MRNFATRCRGAAWRSPVLASPCFLDMTSSTAIGQWLRFRLLKLPAGIHLSWRLLVLMPPARPQPAVWAGHFRRWLMSPATRAGAGSWKATGRTCFSLPSSAVQQCVAIRAPVCRRRAQLQPASSTLSVMPHRRPDVTMSTLKSPARHFGTPISHRSKPE